MSDQNVTTHRVGTPKEYKERIDAAVHEEMEQLFRALRRIDSAKDGSPEAADDAEAQGAPRPFHEETVDRITINGEEYMRVTGLNEKEIGSLRNLLAMRIIAKKTGCSMAQVAWMGEDRHHNHPWPE
jgi:hypothetical protein